MKITLSRHTRVQLIEIDEKLLKSLKFLALSKNIKLNALVKQILLERTKSDISQEILSCYSEKDAINFHNFMKALFEKKSQQKMNSKRLTEDQKMKSRRPPM